MYSSKLKSTTSPTNSPHVTADLFSSPLRADKAQLEQARKDGTLIETLVELGLYDWQDLVHHHIGYAVLAGFGIVLALLLPFAGLVVCCCRCSGRCGARVASYDKKKDGCRRWCLGISLCLLVVVIL